MIIFRLRNYWRHIFWKIYMFWTDVWCFNSCSCSVYYPFSRNSSVVENGTTLLHLEGFTVLHMFCEWYKKYQ